MGDAASERARRAPAEALGRYLVATYALVCHRRAIRGGRLQHGQTHSDLAGESSTHGALRLAETDVAANDISRCQLFLDRRDEPTFADSRYSSILDHILVSPALAARFDASKVLVLTPPPGQGKIPTSDHNMVIAEILPPRGN